MGTGRGQPVGGVPLDFGWKLCSNEKLGIRNEGGGFAANIYGGDARKWWGQRYGGNAFPTYGEPTPSRYARQPLPEEGARMWGISSVSIPPSFGRRCPQGGGWATQSGVKKERLKQAIYESTRAPLTRSPFPDGEGKLVATSPQNRKGDARRSLKYYLRASPHLYIAALLYFYAPHHPPEP